MAVRLSGQQFPKAAIGLGPLTAILLMSACGGPGIPSHTGYKSPKAKPWKKPKSLALGDKDEVKVDGELSYAAYKRARWYSVQLPQTGDLTVTTDATAPAELDDFDLAFEILDPNYNVIAKADSEEEDAKEAIKKRTVAIEVPGRYLIHVYLQRRIDAAEYEMRVGFAPTGGTTRSDFPAGVEFLGDLPLVPIADDTPLDRRPKPVREHRPRSKPRDREPVASTPAPPPPPSTTFSGTILRVQVGGGGSEITFSRAQGVQSGMKGRVAGVSQNSGFTVGDCNDRTCKAHVQLTPDQIGSGKVVIAP